MKVYMNKKVIIVSLVLFVLMVTLLVVGLFLNNKNNQAEPNQNKTVDSASGLEVLSPDDRVPELGGGESIPVIGTQKLYDAGAPKTIVEPIVSELKAYGISLQPKAQKISIYKDSVRQAFTQDNPLTTVVFDILVSDKDKLSVSADYLSIEFIDTLVITDQSGGIVYNYTISGD